jgi:2'-5' RNA ligase
MASVQASVGNGTTRIRWVGVEGLHLTLRFLGPTPIDQVPALRSSADAVATSRPRFDVELAGGGAFPSLARPRSLWVGVTSGAEDLAALADGLSRAAAAMAGAELDTRPFTPHLTIGRTDGLRSAPVVARTLVAAADGVTVRFRATGLVLYRSLLGHGPARYEPVHESPFG